MIYYLGIPKVFICSASGACIKNCREIKLVSLSSYLHALYYQLSIIRYHLLSNSFTERIISSIGDIMKKAVALLLIILSLGCFPLKAGALSVSAESAVLYCVDNNKVYFSKNENKHMRPASTTKIMTALITLEFAEKNNRKVRFTEDMISEGSSMYLKVGDVVTLRDLAVGMMMCSGNDAAKAAAISIAGSEEKFSELMNRRARKIGMKNTNFETPSGLDDKDHYTTAYDMALLMSEALKNPEFKKLTCKKSETVRFINPDNKITTYANHNRLLSLNRYCIGGKTGFTKAAGRCLVTAAKKDGLTLISVTLRAERDWYDHNIMYNYGYENYRMKTLCGADFFLDVDTVGGEKSKTALGAQRECKAVVSAKDYNKIKSKYYIDNFLYAPQKSGDKAGKIEYLLNGKKIASAKLTVAEDNNSLKENKSIWDNIKGFFNNAF